VDEPDWSEVPAALPEELEPLAVDPDDTEPCTMPIEEPPELSTDALEDELPPDVELPPADDDEV